MKIIIFRDSTNQNNTILRSLFDINVSTFHTTVYQKLS